PTSHTLTQITETSVNTSQFQNNDDSQQREANSQEEKKGNQIQNKTPEVDEENLQQQILSSIQQLYESFNDHAARLEKLEQLQQEHTHPEYNMKEQLNKMLAPLQSELRELAQKHKHNTTSLQAEREEINQINNQISEQKGWLQWVGKELKSIKQLLSLLGRWVQNNPEYLPSTTTVIPPEKQQTPTKPATIVETEEESKLPMSEEEQLLKDYKENRAALSQNAIAVSATEKSIDNIRSGFGQLVLEPKRRGNYWILKRGTSLYLVPSDTMKINEYSIETLQKLFECEGVNSEGYKDKFELLKPAKVSSIGEEKWQLFEPGKLEFID
ncbi:MAG: hypothetical protein F6K17_12310, partial [Okeania sp. SIO3C4]|nr:hypothetical protein [Okeania sp. SIO3C4]